MDKKTIADLVMEYFKRNPKKDLEHGPVVDWVEEQYLKLYEKNPVIYGGKLENFTKKVN